MSVALPHPEASPAGSPSDRRPNPLRRETARPRLEVVRTSDELSSVVLVEASPSPHDAVIASLREHLATLATRYAEHVADLERRLDDKREEAEEGWRIAQAAQARAKALTARVGSLEQALSLTQSTVTDLEARNARLAEAASLPWWAFKRRRELVEGA